jgi:transposase-like protein
MAAETLPGAEGIQERRIGMTIDWLDLICPSCGSTNLVSVRQLAHAVDAFTCEACGDPLGSGTTRRAGQRSSAGADAARVTAQGPTARLP